MLKSCGTFVIVHVASLKFESEAVVELPANIFQFSSILILTRLLRYFASRRSTMVAEAIPAMRKTANKTIKTRIILIIRISFLLLSLREYVCFIESTRPHPGRCCGHPSPPGEGKIGYHQFCFSSPLLAERGTRGHYCTINAFRTD